jgi:protein PhnA
MNLSNALAERCGKTCELCNGKTDLNAFTVAPRSDESIDNQVVICKTCASLMERDDLTDTHWRCLSESIWNPVEAVQALSYRLLQRVSAESWANDALSSVYLEDSTIEWALAQNKVLIHKDSNGNRLENGDTVVLTQELNVKGANFSAKRGTSVRKIRLVADNAEQIEGRINEQLIVILTKYVKKA